MVLNKLKKPKERSNANPTEKKPQGRWDEHNRPIGYIIGVTPGFAQFRQGAERMALSGLAKKIAFGARQGFDFVEVDFESIAEAYEHGVEDEVKRVVEAQGPYFGFGIHAPVTGEIAIDLGVANAYEWERHHRNVQRTAIIAKKTGAKFILFHTSHKPRPGLVYYLAAHEYPVPQYSFTGENLAMWIEKVSEGKFKDPSDGKKKHIPWFKEWFKARFVNVLYRVLGSVPNAEVSYFLSTTEQIETDEGPKYPGRDFKERVVFAARELNRMKLKYWKLARPKILEELDKKIRELENKTKEAEKLLDLTPDERKRLSEINAQIIALKSEITQIEKMIRDLGYQLEVVSKEEEKENIINEIRKLEERKESNERKINELQIEAEGIKEKAQQRQRDPGKAGYFQALNEELKNYYVIKHKVEMCDESRIPDENKLREEIEELLRYSIVYRIFTRVLNDGVAPEEALRKGNGAVGLSRAYKHFMLCSDVIRTVLNMDFDQLFELWKQQGSEAQERVSYEVVAKYMSETGDFLWKEIVEREAGCRIKPDLAIDRANKGESVYEDDKGNRAKIPVQKIIELIITAVACKYIQGHLLVKTPPWNMGGLPEQVREWRIEKEQDKGSVMDSRILRDLENDEMDLSIYEYCKKNKIHIFVETEQPAPGLEGQLRVMHAHHHIALVKSIEKGEHISYTIDFEHLTTNLIDPIKDVEENIREGDAKYVRMVHINAPRPYGGLHGQIQLFSLDMYILYKWLWLLRKKGMKNAYLIWEWGAAGPPEDSAVALRLMIKHLEEDWPPDKLPPEFYGLGPEFEAAQYQAIRMHAMDPIEGLLTLPEHSYTFFGERAKEMNRLAQWIRNKFRW